MGLGCPTVVVSNLGPQNQSLGLEGLVGGTKDFRHTGVRSDGGVVRSERTRGEELS